MSNSRASEYSRLIGFLSKNLTVRPSPSSVIDIAGFIWAVKSTGGFTPESMDAIFSSDEMSIVASIIGFYFGSRTWEKKKSGE